MYCMHVRRPTVRSTCEATPYAGGHQLRAQHGGHDGAQQRQARRGRARPANPNPNPNPNPIPNLHQVDVAGEEPLELAAYGHYLDMSSTPELATLAKWTPEAGLTHPNLTLILT